MNNFNNFFSKEELQLIKFFEKKRKDFPILNEKINGHNLIYFDNGATTQKPKILVEKLTEYYFKYNSNIHRSAHTLAGKSELEFEKVRSKVLDFLNAKHSHEVIFTKGTTDSLNKVAFGLIDEIKKGDEIMISEMEHHSNFVCWQEIVKIKKAKLKIIPIKKDFTLDLNYIKKNLSTKTKILSISHISNVLGTINPIEEIFYLSKKFDVITILDGAQSIPHMKVDLKNLYCDFLVFSAHKMAGPTGLGFIVMNKKLIENLKPSEFGGSMIYEVFHDKTTFLENFRKMEAGTPNIADVIAFGGVLDYLNEIGMETIENYEKLLTKYFLFRLKELENFNLIGSKILENRSCVFSFTITGVHPHDISSILDKYGIAIRGGHHCSMPLHNVLNINSSSRISLYFYNTINEIDFVIDKLKFILNDFEKGNFI